MKSRTRRKHKAAGGAARARLRWVAMGTLVACASVVRHPVWAQERRGDAGAGHAPGRAEALPVFRFDIPQGPLGAALDELRAATGVTILAADPGLRELASPGVSGVLTVEQALRGLLAGTNLAYHFEGRDQVRLELQPRSESVTVTARARVSSAKYTAELRDTPQMISVIPKTLIEEQGATTLRDVLQNVPGLTITAGEGGAPAGDNLTLRGFSARNDVFVDGVRDLGPQSRDPFNLEQVEVVKGPGSAYTGRGSTGGTINLVSKAPNLAPGYAGSLALGSAAARRVTVDLNQPLAGQAGAFRLNVMAHDADVPGREAVSNRRWGVAPSLAFGLGTPTRLTASYFHLEQDNLSDYGIPWVPATHNALAAWRDRPAPVPRDTFYGFAERDREELASDLATLRLERDFGSSTRLRGQLRYGRSTRDSMATPPRFAGNDTTTINREMRSWQTEDDIWDGQVDLTASFATGAARHSLVTGVALSHEGNVRRTRTAPNSPTTLLDPDPSDAYTGVITPGATAGDVTGQSVAVFVFDSARLGERLELSAGLRFDRFDVSGVTTAAAPIARVDQMLSFRAGVVYKPRAAGSLYAAYGTSLNPSLEGLSYGVANTAIEPERTRSFEAGSKWDLFDQRLSLAGALFRVEKTDARTPGVLPGDPPQVLDGRQRVDGIELGVSGSVTRRLRVFAAYTLLDSRIVDSNTPAEVGRALQNTPRHALSLWTTCRLPGRLELGGGARFVGRRYGNNTNTRFVDGYWSVDAMASYPLMRRLELKLNLYNLTDAYYFDRLGGGHLVPGAGRSALVTAQVGF